MKQCRSQLYLISGLFISLISRYSCASDPMFHLKNKGSESIQIDLIQQGKSLTGLKTVAKNDDFLVQTLNLTLPVTLELFFCPTKDWCKTQLPEKLVARFETGKHIYIKFTGAGLEVQKGTLGLSTKGYSLKNIAKITSQDFYVGLMSGGRKQYTKTTKQTKTATQKEQSGVEKLTKNKEVSISKKTTPMGYTPVMPSDIVPTGINQGTQSQTTSLQQVGKTKPEQLTMPSQLQSATSTELTGVSKTAPTQASSTPVKQPSNTIPLTSVEKKRVPSTGIMLEKPAIRIAPEGPRVKKQSALEAPDVSSKTGLQEVVTQEKMGLEEALLAKPESKELAWQEFPEANLLRKKLKNGDQSPFVARKVLGLNVGASESDIKKKVDKLEAWYNSRSYRGDRTLVPDIMAIIMNAKSVLLDAIYPTLARSQTSPYKLELQKLFYDAPSGFEDFAAPIYHELVETSQYSRELLQSIQKKVMSIKGIPEQWRQSVLSKIQRELSRIK